MAARAELAVLAALDATLCASAAALIAAHAELEAEDFAASPHPPSARACLAVALLVMQEVWARAAPASEHASN